MVAWGHEDGRPTDGAGLGDGNPERLGRDVGRARPAMVASRPGVRHAASKTLRFASLARRTREDRRVATRAGRARAADERAAGPPPAALLPAPACVARRAGAREGDQRLSLPTHNPTPDGSRFP